MNPRTVALSVQGAFSIAGAFALLALSLPAHAEDKTVYKCPGNLYTDQITPKEADAKGCKPLTGASVTIIQSTPRPSARPGPGASRSADSKVDPAEQRARDGDARKILEAELKREQDRLADLKKEYNNGQPERRGDERNYAKYQERVEDLKSAITRKEADIEAIQRELSKMPQPQQ